MLVFFSQIVGVKITQVATKYFLGWVKFGEMLEHGTQFPMLQPTKPTLELVLTGVLKSVAAESLVIQKLLPAFGTRNVLFPGLGFFVIADVELQVSLVIKQLPAYIARKTNVLLVSFDVVEASFLIHGGETAQ